LHKKTLIAVTLALVILTPIVENQLMNWLVPPKKLVEVVGWSDPKPTITFSNPAIQYYNFADWQLKNTSSVGVSGFKILNGIGDLYVNFTGMPSYVEIEKSISAENVSSTNSPYLVITHQEDNSDESVNFSFGLTDANGKSYYGSWYHVSERMTILSFDMRVLFNGTISKISLRLTNDFNDQYAGGVRNAYISSLAIYSEAPSWSIISDKPVDASLETNDHILTISAPSSIPEYATVAAQRVGGFYVNLSEFGFLKISIKTSSLHVAAKVAVWDEIGEEHVVLLKTYNDELWHDEIVDLKAFNVNVAAKIVMIQLALLNVEHVNSSVAVSYKDLAFVRWT
jgi:hypothetical protein